MKYLYLHIAQNCGGVEKRFFTLYQYILKQTNDDVTVIIGRTFLKSINRPLIPREGGRIIKYGFPWTYRNKVTRYLDYISLVLVLLMQYFNKYDVAHFSIMSGLLFRKLVRAKKKGTSAVCSAREQLKAQIESKLFSQILKENFLIDCLDTNICEEIRLYYPQHSNQLCVSPCSFIDMSAIYNNKIEIKKEHAIAFVGRLIDIKGINLLIEVLPQLIKRTKFKIYILGRGYLSASIRNMIDLYNCSDRIFLSYVTDPTLYLAKTKVFLSLQRDENYPSQSLLEAMACRNAIIATNVGLTHLIVKDDFGFLINNTKQLLDTLIYLDKNQALCESMGRLAEKFMINNHQIEKFYNYIKSIYRN